MNRTGSSAIRRENISLSRSIIRDRSLDINVDDLRVTRQLDVGAFVRGIAMSARRKGGCTRPNSSRRECERLILQQWKVVDQWPGLTTDNLCRQIVLNPRRPKAYIAHIRSRTSVAQGDGLDLSVCHRGGHCGGRGQATKPHSDGCAFWAIW